MKTKNFDHLKELIDRIGCNHKKAQLSAHVVAMRDNFISARLDQKGLIVVTYFYKDTKLTNYGPNPSFFFKNPLNRIICLEGIYYRIGIINRYENETFVQFTSRYGTNCSIGTPGSICLVPV